jgi:hypothetical protein
LGTQLSQTDAVAAEPAMLASSTPYSSERLEPRTSNSANHARLSTIDNVRAKLRNIQERCSA